MVGEMRVHGEETNGEVNGTVVEDGGASAIGG